MKIERIAITMIAILASFEVCADGPSARSLFANSAGVSFDSSAGTQPQIAPTPRASKKSSSEAFPYMGMSYTVYQKLPNGDVVTVSPKKRFKTNDLIAVEVTSNSSGVISAANVNPQGEFSFLGSQAASPGAAVRIPNKGYLRFVGDSGMEKLIFLLSAQPIVQSTAGEEKVATVFTTCETRVTTRSLVVDDEAGNQYRVIKADGTCSVEVAEKETKTRSLVVDVSEDKGYGVVPKKKIESGEILALGIALRHE